MTFGRWQAVQHAPLGMLAGTDVPFAQWPTGLRNKAIDSMAAGVKAGYVDPAWTEAQLTATVVRVGEAWELRVTWSPASAPPA